MRLMLVRNTDGEEFYINPNNIETIIKDYDYIGHYEITKITFISGNCISINESVYDFVQDLKRSLVDKVTLY